MATIKQMFKELVDITPKFVVINKNSPQFKSLDKAFTAYFEKVIFPELKDFAKKANGYKQVAITAEKLKTFGFEEDAINKSFFKEFLKHKFFDTGFAIEICFEDDYDKVTGCELRNKTKDTTDDISLIFSWKPNLITEYDASC